MKRVSRLAVPITAAAIAVTALFGAPFASAAPATICQYKVSNSPNGLFIRSAPNSTAHTMDKVPNGTAGVGSLATTNGFRSFRGGWASAAYLTLVSGTCVSIGT
ncbi:hypothetical protein GCM10007304_01260 [Rhodococcoides trifolii]|uniref:Uncharacterized protein n=1 Tax=Rhodococcoides trifolii TaxID=908250 RepID=A0A917FN72_9NOCA|nr:SH3 domain-containing protein [Rhodococcus trifolii]GGF91062.1 hypothetical protein GCM10007304_01260 [Rhodococcus trifolii]